MSTLEHATQRRILTKRTESLLVAIVFAVLVTACSWFLLPMDPDRSNAWQGLLWLIHAPAAIAYIGTLAEHDPWKGSGFFIFAFLQWAVVGLGLGWLEATLRRARTQT